MHQTTYTNEIEPYRLGYNAVLILWKNTHLIKYVGISHVLCTSTQTLFYLYLLK